MPDVRVTTQSRATGGIVPGYFGLPGILSWILEKLALPGATKSGLPPTARGESDALIPQNPLQYATAQQIKDFAANPSVMEEMARDPAAYPDLRHALQIIASFEREGTLAELEAAYGRAAVAVAVPPMWYRDP